MASAASSPVSSGSSVYDVSEEKTNGTKLIRLMVDVGTHVLRSLLLSVYQPDKLQVVLNNNKAKLQKLRRKGVIFKKQWEMLFPTSGDPPDSEKFDITLIHLLLREICHLAAPSTGWHIMPADDDSSPEANITRIKCFRNELLHVVSTGIPNNEFEIKWSKISSAIESLEISIQRNKIQTLKTNPIDHETQQYLEEQVKQWKLMEGQDSSNVMSDIYSCLPDKLPEELMFGRSQEIQKVKEIIQNEIVPVALITGGPGFGKTTVATAVAHQLVKTENGRIVLFCSLSSKKILNEVATEMIHSCGAVQTQVPENPVQWLKDWSKRIQTQVTFVLDNADDILDSNDRTSFLNLLVSLRMLSAQNVTCVITTRKTFKDPKMQTSEVRLNPLSTEEAKSILVSRVYDQNVRKRLCKMDEIVELCGCVPLALCVVGSLLLDYSEEKLIKNLQDQPLKVLEDDQMSVEKAIKTSFDLLTSDEQRALVLMSVFPGSFDSDAAEVIVEACASSETLPISILRSLKNRSLVEQPSSQRYQLHSLIKAFAKSVDLSALSLAKGEKVACAHYMSRLAENADCYWGKDTCKTSLDSFNEDRHNFEYFLQAFAQWRGSEGYVAMNSCEAFFVNLHQKCLYLEMCLLPRFYTQFLQKLLAANTTEINPVHKVELLCLLGHEMRKVGEGEKYKNSMEEAHKLYSENKTEFDKYALSEVIYLNSHARYLSEQNSYARNLSERSTPTAPKEVYDDALRICEQKLRNHPERAATLLFAGRHDKRLKNFKEAEEKLNEALKLLKECLGEHLMTAQCLKDIADLKFKEDNGSFAVDYYKQSLEMMEHLGMDGHKETILTLKNFGSRQSNNGNYEEAKALFERAERVAERELEKDHAWKVKVKTEQAIVFYEEKREDQMEEAMKSGLEMWYRLGKTVQDLNNKYLIRRILDCYPEKFPKDKYPH